MRWPPCSAPRAAAVLAHAPRASPPPRAGCAPPDRTGPAEPRYDGVAYTRVGTRRPSAWAGARSARLLRPRGVGGGDDARPRWRHRAAAVGDVAGLFAGGGLDVMTTALWRRCLRRHHARACSTLQRLGLDRRGAPRGQRRRRAAAAPARRRRRRAARGAAQRRRRQGARARRLRGAPRRPRFDWIVSNLPVHNGLQTDFMCSASSSAAPRAASAPAASSS